MHGLLHSGVLGVKRVTVRAVLWRWGGAPGAWVLSRNEGYLAD